MRRILLLVAVALFAAVLWRIRTVSEFPESSVPPKSGDLDGKGIEAVWAGAPPPAFTVLHRRSVYTPAPGSDEFPVVQTEELRLVEAAGWRSVVRSDVRVVRDDGGPTPTLVSYWAGPPDIFPAIVSVEVVPSTPRYREFSRVGAVYGVQGGLFPLAAGKRLRLYSEMDRYTGWDHRRLKLREDYSVVGTTDRWARGPAAVPGPVFVIRHVLDGDLGHQEVEMHYSTRLGVVVYEREDHAARGEGEDGIREVTLTDWR
jgi:hypothetical protein